MLTLSGLKALRSGTRMAGSLKLFLSEQLSAARRAIVSAFRALREKGPEQVTFWFIALAIGVASGLAALGFRLGIGGLQAFLYGVDDPRHIHSYA